MRLYNALENRDTITADEEIIKINSIGIEKLNDSIKSDFYYAVAIRYLAKGDSINSLAMFDLCREYGEKSQLYEPSYFESVYIIMSSLFRNGQYVECANLGKRISHNKSIEQYERWRDIYIIWSLSVEMQYRLEESIEILNYASKTLTNDSQDYFYIKCHLIDNYLMKGDIASADSLISKIREDFSNSQVRTTRIQSLISKAEALCNKAHSKYGNLKANALEDIEKIISNFIFNDKEQKIKNLSLIRNQLAIHCFNENSKNDERFWNKCLAYLTVCSYLESGAPEFNSSELYENALVRKDFLDWHFGSHYREKYCTNDVRMALSNNEVAIEMNILPEELLVLSSKNEEPLRIPIDSTLFDYLYFYNFENKKSINDLYDFDSPLSKLWQTIEPYLGGINAIYISPSYFYKRINWEAITINSKGDRVLDKYDIRYLISTSDLCVNKEKSSDLINDIVLYGGIQYNTPEQEMKNQASRYRIDNNGKWSLSRDIDDERRTPFSNLPGTLEEINSIKLICEKNGYKNEILTGTYANEESFKNMDGKSPSIIHIASHGFALFKQYEDGYRNEYKFMLDTTYTSNYSASMSRAGIALSGANRAWCGDDIPRIEDGILTAYEISKMDLSNTQIVVLSACETGLGDLNNITGTCIGLQHAFRMAGVDKSVVSLWKISDEVTSIFMKSFYKSLLKEQNSIRRAIKKAQKELINKGYKDPYYWAAFVTYE